MIDGDWITTMRTGAVAALSVRLFANKGVRTFSLMGLGNTARATALCLMCEFEGQPVKFRLLKYKDQAQSFIERFGSVDNVTFEIVDSINDFVEGAEVLISCITSADCLICDDDTLFSPGMLLVPVHTRGFQNCDLFFNKVFGDDRGHIQGFRHFHQFKHFDEIGHVLLGQSVGRESELERILCYNIGLGLHDAVFASKIYDLVGQNPTESYIQRKETDKFWI